MTSFGDTYLPSRTPICPAKIAITGGGHNLYLVHCSSGQTLKSHQEASTSKCDLKLAAVRSSKQTNNQCIYPCQHFKRKLYKSYISDFILVAPSGVLGPTQSFLMTGG